MRFNISNEYFIEQNSFIEQSSFQQPEEDVFTSANIHFICIALILIFSAILSTIIHRNILYEYE